MATVNPDDAEFTCKNPDCPKGVFQQKTILGHIMKARNCKVFYSEEEISSMRETSIAIQKKTRLKKERGKPSHQNLKKQVRIWRKPRQIVRYATNFLFLY